MQYLRTLYILSIYLPNSRMSILKPLESNIFIQIMQLSLALAFIMQRYSNCCELKIFMWVEERIPVVLQVLVAQVWFLIHGSPGASPGRRNTSVLTPWLLFAGVKCRRRKTVPTCSPAWAVLCVPGYRVYAARACFL